MEIKFEKNNSLVLFFTPWDCDYTFPNFILAKNPKEFRRNLGLYLFEEIWIPNELFSTFEPLIQNYFKAVKESFVILNMGILIENGDGRRSLTKKLFRKYTRAT